MSVYLRFSFNILVRIYPVKTPFSQNFPAARADRPCAYFFEIFTFRKSRCAFISFQKSPESGSVRLLRGGAFIYNTPVYSTIVCSDLIQERLRNIVGDKIFCVGGIFLKFTLESV